MNKLTLVLFLLSTGCAATQARPLSSLDLQAPNAIVPATTRSVTVGPFTDDRGPTFSATHHVPVLGLLHHSARFFYPDVAGVMRGHDEFGSFVTTGSLDASLPDMLAETMRRMQVSPSIVSGSRGTPCDYYVEGRLIDSTLRRDVIPIARLLAPLGVPFEVNHMNLAYEIDVYDASSPEPIFRQTYGVRGARAKGLYYNHDAGVALLTSELNATLPTAARDIAHAIALAESRH
jgi:hypothetical protein